MTTTIRFTTPARKLFVKVCECLSEVDKTRFTRRLELVFDRKITGDEQLADFNITEKDIHDALELCSFVDRKKLGKIISNP